MADSASVEVPPPRLMITHMVNNNFKSYFGTQIVGPFHKVRRRRVLQQKIFSLQILKYTNIDSFCFSSPSCDTCTFRGYVCARTLPQLCTHHCVWLESASISFWGTQNLLFFFFLSLTFCPPSPFQTLLSPSAVLLVGCWAKRFGQVECD